MTSFQLLSTAINLAITGGVQENFNGKSYSLSDSYSFAQTLTNGTGSLKAQLAVITGSLQLTAVANPSSPPTLTPSGAGGTIPAGTYTLKYTYYNGSGETIGSATAQATTTGTTSSIGVTVPALPAGASGINVYLTAGGTGTGKVATAAANTVTITDLSSPTGSLPSATLSTATIAGQIDLTAIPSPGKTFDFSGTDDGNGAGGAGGVKMFWMEQTDTSPGQQLTFLSPANVWTNGLGTGRPPLGMSPSMFVWFDATGRAVSPTNKLVKVQALYNVPIVKYGVVGEASWF